MDVKFLFRVFCVLLIVAVFGAGCDNKGSKKSKAPTDVAGKTTTLATIAADEKPQSITPASGLGMHAPLPASYQFIFSELGGGVAYVAEKNGTSYVVHNGIAGKQYTTVGTVSLSPDGRRIAYGALVDGKWCMVVDGMEGASFNTVKSPVFSPDGRHVAYEAMAGERWHLVVDITPNPGTLQHYLTHEFNADSSKIAYIDDVDDKNTGRLVVSDLAFKQQKIIGTGVSHMVANAEKTRTAAISVSDNKQSVIEFSFDNPDDVKKGVLYDAVHNLAFGPDGVSLAYDAERGDKRLIILNGREELLPGGTLVVEPPVVSPDQKVVGVIIANNNAAFLHQSFLGSITKEDGYDEAVNLVYGRDSSIHAYAARKGENWFAVVNGKQGPVFERVVSPMFSPDGKSLVYRARKDGKRFVVVADTNGKTIKTYPTYEQVFPVFFTADGNSIAYGVKDGQKLIWKVERL